MSDAKDDKYIDTRDIAEHIRAIAYENENDESLTDEDRAENADTLRVYGSTLAEMQQFLDRTISEEDDPEGMADDFDRLGYVAMGRMVREDYFADYTEEFLREVGALPEEFPEWVVIDWEATADNLKADWTDVLHDGVSYLFQ